MADMIDTEAEIEDRAIQREYMNFLEDEVSFLAWLQVKHVVFCSDWLVFSYFSQSIQLIHMYNVSKNYLPTILIGWLSISTTWDESTRKEC